MDKDKAADQLKPRRRPGRVPVSCAECRRLKLRCDRKVPCEACTKRGCAAICPNGTLAPGKANNKYVLANTEELHMQIDRMTRRIRELEHGLGSLQATVSDEAHPLLGKQSISADGSGPSSTPSHKSTTESIATDGEDDEAIDALGTLSIGARGDIRFFGATARGEYLLQATRESPRHTYFDCSKLDDRLLSVTFPEASNEYVDPEIRGIVLSHLPRLEEARELCDIFVRNSAYFCSSAGRDQLSDTIDIVYHNKPTPDASPATHSLSLLFIIFGIAKLFTDCPNYQMESHEYFLLSRVALTFDTPLVTTTVISVQAMCYMAEYLEMSDVSLIPTGCAKAWMYLGLAMKMAHSIGLHLKSARFGLDDATSQMRSRVFWHLFTVDAWSSFTFGRPPSTALNFIDSEFPKDEGVVIEKDGTESMSFEHWNYLFVQLLHQVMTTAFSAKLPPYSAILELDRKLRDFHVPDYLRPTSSTADEAPDSFLRLKRWLTLSNKEWALLNIHRAYFATALRERPLDPLKHKYGLSVMALFRSAYRIVESCEITMRTAPPIFFRSNFACSKVLSASIVMCVLVCSASSSNLAPASLDVLDKTYEIFQHGIETGSLLATENGEAVKILHKQAHDVMEKNPDRETSPLGLTCEELDRLCGRTRVISSSPLTNPEAAPVSMMDSTEDHIISDYKALCGGNCVMQSGLPAYDFGPSTSQFPHPVAGSSSLQTPVVPSMSSEPMQNISFSGFDAALSGLPQQSGQAFGMGQQTQPPYILDASWHSFIQQLGF